jgi:hypothetical protein
MWRRFSLALAKSQPWRKLVTLYVAARFLAPGRDRVASRARTASATCWHVSTRPKICHDKWFLKSFAQPRPNPAVGCLASTLRIPVIRLVALTIAQQDRKRRRDASRTFNARDGHQQYLAKNPEDIARLAITGFLRIIRALTLTADFCRFVRDRIMVKRSNSIVITSALEFGDFIRPVRQHRN